MGHMNVFDVSIVNFMVQCNTMVDFVVEQEDTLGQLLFEYKEFKSRTSTN